MTDVIEKDAAWLVDELRAALPKADITPYKGHRDPMRNLGGGWVIDAVYQGHYLVVMWTKATGFGISTPEDDPAYTTSSDETIKDADVALERVVRLLKSGDRAGAVKLDELRSLLGASQDRLAQAMDVTQSMVSQTENREDVLLSTLQSYVKGLGGELELTAKFKNDRYRLTIGDLKKG